MKRVLFILFAIILIFGCDKRKSSTDPGIDGHGETVVQEYSVSGFNGIDLVVPSTVFYTQDSVYTLTIHAQQNILDVIEAEVVGTSLKIEFTENVNNHDDITIYVSSPDLAAFAITGYAEVNSDTLETEVLSLSITGAGEYNFFNLDLDYLNSAISGAGTYNLTSADTLESHNISIAGSGTINSFELISEDVAVSISGSGTCKVYAVENLDVSISGNGTVTYKGYPDVTTNISGNGVVINGN